VENVREQIQRIRSHPWIPKEIPVRGFVYDVQTGRLGEVTEARAASSVTSRLLIIRLLQQAPTGSV